jgi:hypothetical protein
MINRLKIKGEWGKRKWWGVYENRILSVLRGFHSG